jgi:hypothetical protein
MNRAGGVQIRDEILDRGEFPHWVERPLPVEPVPPPGIGLVDLNRLVLPETSLREVLERAVVERGLVGDIAVEWVDDLRELFMDADIFSARDFVMGSWALNYRQFRLGNGGIADDTIKMLLRHCCDVLYERGVKYGSELAMHFFRQEMLDDDDFNARFDEQDANDAELSGRWRDNVLVCFGWLSSGEGELRSRTVVLNGNERRCRVLNPLKRAARLPRMSLLLMVLLRLLVNPRKKAVRLLRMFLLRMVLLMPLVMFRAGVTVVLLTTLLLWPMVLQVATLYLLLSLAAW